MNPRQITALLLALPALCFGQGLKKGAQEDVEKYFHESLCDTATSFTNKQKIKIKDIESTRAEVWACWKEKVHSFEEEKLPPLAAAHTRDTLLWSIPTHPEAGARMPFHYIYKGEKPAEGYPLFLYLHGSAAKEQEWDSGYHLCRAFDDAPAAYFIPQIPSEKLYRWAVPSQQKAWEKLLRLALAGDDIDPNRIYLFGISEGGYGSQRLASFYADYLAAAGPMAGGEPLQNAPAENLANTAFTLRTGEKDFFFGRNYLTYITAKTLDSLQTLHPTHYKHLVMLIPGQGHSIDYNHTTPWLKQHTRTPHPTYFYWEDYDMYGRHRKGFHNLRVNSPSRNSDEERTCYEMRIEGNNIYLTVKNTTYTTRESYGGIAMTFDKHHTKATKGDITIFLSEKLFDLEKPIIVVLNGKIAHNGKVQPTLRSMVESCALFYDPERVFPASIDITIE